MPGEFAYYYTCFSVYYLSTADEKKRKRRKHIDLSIVCRYFDMRRHVENLLPFWLLTRIRVKRCLLNMGGSLPQNR